MRGASSVCRRSLLYAQGSRWRVRKSLPGADDSARFRRHHLPRATREPQMSEHYTHPGPDLRASDADRESMAEQLRRHHADGRLDTDEFQERIDRCYDARTVGELGALTTDLPRPQEVSRRRSGAALSVRRLWALPVVPIVIAVIVVG